MKTILLARHGQASFGKDNYDKLSELGVKQSHLLGKHYADIAKQVDNVVTGTLVRQQESGKHFSKPFLLNSGRSMPVHTIAEFDEFDHNDILFKYVGCNNIEELQEKYDQAINTKKMAEVFQQAMIRWHKGDHDDDYNESWTQFSQRVQEGLEKAIEKTEDGEVTLVFTSGGVIASIVSQLLAKSMKDKVPFLMKSMNSLMLMNQVVNAGVTTILVGYDETDDSELKLLGFNAYEHLLNDDTDMITWI